jgi:deoxycytidine triphosphate deaminase
MIQGLDILKKLVNEKNLVENLCERELSNPENAGFDLRLGEVYSLKGDAFIGIKERKTPETKLVARFEKNKKKVITIKPGEYFLGKTIERINTPKHLFGVYFLRSTYWRSGIKLVSGMLGPGYCGEVSFPLSNAGPSDIKIELGARIIHVLFIRIEGQTSEYKGIWQGGRISASRTEKQI